MLPSVKSSSRWISELSAEAKKLEIIKKNIDFLDTSTESLFDLIEEEKTDNNNLVRNTTEADIAED